MLDADQFVAVVLGLSPTGLYAARELSTLGVEVLGVARGPQCGAVSRALSHRDGAWRVDSDADLLARLRELEDRDPRRFFIIPADDLSIEFLMTHGTSLGDRFLYQSSYSTPATRNLLDKRRFARVCEQAGVPAPRSWSGPPSEVLSHTAAFSFPLVLKPGMIHQVASFMAGRKLLLVQDREEMAATVDSIPEDSGGWVVQELVPGPESRIVMVAGHRRLDGELQEVVTARKLRQYPPGFGSASLVRTDTVEDVVNLTARLLEAAGYKGIFASEFKYDERDGCFKVLEINARPSLWFNITRHAGARIVGSVFAEVTGTPLPPTDRVTGEVRWQYGLKDLYSRMSYAFGRGGHALPPPGVPRPSSDYRRCWAVAEKGDWLPVLMELYSYALKALRRGHRAIPLHGTDPPDTG